MSDLERKTAAKSKLTKYTPEAKSALNLRPKTPINYKETRDKAPSSKTTKPIEKQSVKEIVLPEEPISYTPCYYTPNELIRARSVKLTEIRRNIFRDDTFAEQTPSIYENVQREFDNLTGLTLENIELEKTIKRRSLEITNWQENTFLGNNLHSKSEEFTSLLDTSLDEYLQGASNSETFDPIYATGRKGLLKPIKDSIQNILNKGQLTFNDTLFTLNKKPERDNLKQIEENITSLLKNPKFNNTNRMSVNPTTTPIIEIKSFLTGISQYKGDEKELEAFINNCDLYVELADATQQPTLLRIIKAKLSGEVLQKIGSVDTFTTWLTLKHALREGIKPLISFAGAQEAVATNKQLPTQNMRQYGAKMKILLEEMNNTQHIVNSVEAVKLALRAQNERQAITKFSQNILNPELQRLVSACNKPTLDETISYAAEKELWIKSSTLLKCSICNKKAHLEFDCKPEDKPSTSKETATESSQVKKPITCYRCGKVGHPAVLCRSPPNNGRFFNNSNKTNQYRGNNNNNSSGKNTGGNYSGNYSGNYGGNNNNYKNANYRNNSQWYNSSQWNNNSQGNYRKNNFNNNPQNNGNGYKNNKQFSNYNSQNKQYSGNNRNNYQNATNSQNNANRAAMAQMQLVPQTIQMIPQGMQLVPVDNSISLN